MGVLDVVEATTNQGAVAMAERMFPGEAVGGGWWAVGGSFGRRAGRAAGMDMFALWVVENYGREVAETAFAGLDFEPRDVTGELVPLGRYEHVKA
jgi:hypothetical protein